VRAWTAAEGSVVHLTHVGFAVNTGDGRDGMKSSGGATTGAATAEAAAGVADDSERYKERLMTTMT